MPSHKSGFNSKVRHYLRSIGRFNLPPSGSRVRQPTKLTPVCFTPRYTATLKRKFSHCHIDPKWFSGRTYPVICIAHLVIYTVSRQFAPRNSPLSPAWIWLWCRFVSWVRCPAGICLKVLFLDSPSTSSFLGCLVNRPFTLGHCVRLVNTLPQLALRLKNRLPI